MSSTAQSAAHTRWTTVPGSGLRLAPGTETNGLAVALRELVALNVRMNTKAARRFSRLDIAAALRLTDMESPVVLDFQRGALTVYAGKGPRTPDVEILTDARGMIALAETPKLGGLPDPRTASGRCVLRRLLSGRLRLRGAMRHPSAFLAVSSLTDVHRDDNGELAAGVQASAPVPR